MIETKYKDFQIRFNEGNEDWELVGEGLTEFSLKKLKKEIDKMIKDKIDGFKVIRLSYDLKTIDEYTLTNAGTPSSYDLVKVFWMRTPSGERQKNSLNNFYADTKSNRDIMEEIIKLTDKVRLIDIQVGEKKKTLEPAKFGG